MSYLERKRAWQAEFIGSIHGGESLPSVLPPIVVSRGPHQRLLPSPPDEDLGPGWGHSYEIEDGAKLIFGDLGGER